MKVKTTIRKFSFLTLFAFLSIFTAIAQNEASKTTEGSGPTAEELAKANNPLADMVAFNVQHYFRPTLNEMDGEVIGKFKILKVSILPGAVKLITHTNNLFFKR